MDVLIDRSLSRRRGFVECDANRGEPLQLYAQWVAADPRMRGHVLDVGCGSNYPRTPQIRELLQRCSQLDGVDPNPGIKDHPGLTNRWCTPFEEAEPPFEAYDALFSYWVAEHISDPKAFMKNAYAALKPGGVFYALTPHALHPFPIAVRLVEWLQLKRRIKRAVIQRDTTFATYYRMNRIGSVAAAADSAGFARVEFCFVPSVQWDTYFPRMLRLLPHLYDRLIATKFSRASQLIAYKVEKAEAIQHEPQLK